MELYSASTLAEKEIEMPQMIVNDLLPVGLTVLAGSPKLGKSWFVLLLCLCVALGKRFLGREVYEGDVLLLDLEGSQYRMQERLKIIGMDFPKNLIIAHNSKALDSGLMDDLEDWWSKAPLPKLIVIDTIVRVKGKSKFGKTTYESDSDIFSPLQKFAIEKEISIIVVTHLKKRDNTFGADSDWLERITGSMGLSGVSDNVWGLFRQRGQDTAYLRTSSRDINAGDMVMKFTEGKWEFVSDDIDKYEFESEPMIRFLKEADMPLIGFASEICEKYLQFCKTNSLPHGLSETQPQASFGKKINSLKRECWRINRSVSSNRKMEGIHYHITSID